MNHNGSLYLHLFMTKSKIKQNFLSREFINSKNTIHASGSLTKYIPRKAGAFKLLGSSSSSSSQSSQHFQQGKNSNVPIVHWKPKININLVSTPQNIPVNSLTRELASLIRYITFRPSFSINSIVFLISGLPKICNTHRLFT